jgi:hypothetical protein
VWGSRDDDYDAPSPGEDGDDSWHSWQGVTEDGTYVGTSEGEWGLFNEGAEMTHEDASECYPFSKER